ncbi:MAG TPA: MFS transporter [Clostridiales bacterium]|jgi:melibiose permease/lactose/raffinose/galactose permease|nr:MFS transporter [Clostridiales bacterium]
MQTQDKKRNHQNNHNRWAFGMGTIGRDALYTMVSMYLIYYLTDVLNVSIKTMWSINFVYMGLRIFDALNDPFMGLVVDNTKTRWGKFRPWIVVGAFFSGIFMVFLFTDVGLKGWQYILYFTVAYVLFEVSYTMNDLAYWSMLPALTQEQKEREKIGAVARICANIGLFAVVVGIVPITKALATYTGSLLKAYQVLAIALVLIMWLFQMITVLFCREQVVGLPDEKTDLRDLFRVIIGNDQLLWITLGLLLFMVGYTATTSFGIYYFKYIYGNENMYAVFALVLGISQIVALIIFPLLSKRWKRSTLYSFDTAIVVIGYLLFFLAPAGNFAMIGVAGILIFVGQAMIQLLMLMFITDSVEYGEWKLGRCNDSVTFSLQPFIFKMSGALASGFVGVTLVISGIKTDSGVSELTASGMLFFKVMMMLVPLALIVLGFVIWKKKYSLDEVRYAEILEDLRLRRETAKAELQE